MSVTKTETKVEWYGDENGEISLEVETYEDTATYAIQVRASGDTVEGLLDCLNVTLSHAAVLLGDLAGDVEQVGEELDDEA